MGALSPQVNLGAKLVPMHRDSTKPRVAGLDIQPAPSANWMDLDSSALLFIPPVSHNRP